MTSITFTSNRDGARADRGSNFRAAAKNTYRVTRGAEFLGDIEHDHIGDVWAFYDASGTRVLARSFLRDAKADVVAHFSA